MRQHAEAPREETTGSAAHARSNAPARALPFSAGNAAVALYVQRHGQLVPADAQAGETQAPMEGGHSGSTGPATNSPARAPAPATGGTTTKPADAAPKFGSSADGQFAAGDFAHVQARWAKCNETERAEALAGVVANRLAAAKVPAPGGVAKGGLQATTLGNFGFSTWVINLNKDGILKAASISDAEMEKLAGTLFHEAEHCQQWFRMACYFAGQGNDAAAVAKRLGIPNKIAVEAVAQKIAPGTPDATAIQPIWDSIYGANHDHREAVYKELHDANDAFDAAYKDDPDLKNDATKAALKRADVAFAAYQALPEEVAARQTGKVGEDALRERHEFINALKKAKPQPGDYPTPSTAPGTALA